ncbi:DNA polymerase III subunit gamma/tau [Phocaeicola sp. KGMB11183]|uniref:DNA polymerase III subunit gamma/tau n=1 Tax=Phocaeicola acetigenes TaxID=3016083 RepID=A0ABT4PHF0_9BACT|nr:DNA polymerase III subunit gamma/tau [Phocaeicola sp. KGMB11183]MCZ8372489.1 DNA polymerase III subunit gamma/tau [Phocaeicola sp. KGMB11183]
MENYIVSARKYRPATFDTVVGQKALTTTLKNAIASHKLAHAYLFCGPRGVGKTTCARIFAKTINCLHPTAEGEACNECESCRAFIEQRSYNIHELDAASNNSVEDIRSLIDQVRIPPQIGKYKVYIIDEVHMLSQAAFNAFLKTLEEPPHHAIFILATTEKHKILPTILSRCQIYDFSRISVSDTVEHLENVARKEHIEAEPEALNVIAQKADGGMRDALSIFDQVVSFTNGHITYKSVIENLNVLDYEYYFRLTDFLLENKIAESLLIFNDILKKGFDGNHFITGLTSHLRDLLVSKDEATLTLLEVGASIRERYRAQAQKCTPQFLYQAMKLCNDCDLNYRLSKNKRLLVELTLIQVAQLTMGPENPTPPQGTKKNLSPVFNQGATSVQTNTAQTTGGNTTARPQGNATHSPVGTAPQAPAPQPHAPVAAGTKTTPPQGPSNTPQAAAPKGVQPAVQNTDKKIPVMKAGNLGISIRRPQTVAPTNTSTTATVKAVQPQEEENYEDYIFNEKDLDYYWREFAARLPKEEAANAGRMMNIQPHLLSDKKTFEVVVDNELAQKYMQQLAPQIEAHLRQQLHNRQIRMTTRVSEANENIRAYSHVERFQMMSKKNPDLLKLKEAFGLELS